MGIGYVFGTSVPNDQLVLVIWEHEGIYFAGALTDHVFATIQLSTRQKQRFRIFLH
jgi:hypothetical protein